MGICLGAWWLRGWRYHTILQSLSYQISLVVSTACIFVSQTANLVVPARLGDFVRVFILRHEYNTTYSEGVSSLVVERVFDIVTVAILGAVALVFVLDVPPVYYTIILLPLVAGAIFFVVLFCLGRCSSENKYIRILLTMLHEIKRASLSLRSIIVLGFSSIIIWLLDIFVCVSVVMMFEQQIPFAVVVLAVVIGNLVKAVPINSRRDWHVRDFPCDHFRSCGSIPGDLNPHCGYRSPDQEPRYPCRGNSFCLFLRRLGDPEYQIRDEHKTGWRKRV